MHSEYDEKRNSTDLFLFGVRRLVRSVVHRPNLFLEEFRDGVGARYASFRPLEIIRAGRGRDGLWFVRNVILILCLLAAKLSSVTGMLEGNVEDSSLRLHWYYRPINLYQCYTFGPKV